MRYLATLFFTIILVVNVALAASTQCKIHDLREISNASLDVNISMKMCERIRFRFEEEKYTLRLKSIMESESTLTISSIGGENTYHLGEYDKITFDFNHDNRPDMSLLLESALVTSTKKRILLGIATYNLTGEAKTGMQKSEKNGIQNVESKVESEKENESLLREQDAKEVTRTPLEEGAEGDEENKDTQSKGVGVQTQSQEQKVEIGEVIDSVKTDAVPVPTSVPISAGKFNVTVLVFILVFVAILIFTFRHMHKMTGL